MADNNQEIVELVIEAENLAEDELNEATRDIRGLGDAAKRTERELKKLEIDKANLDSFAKTRTELTKMRKELHQAEIDFEDLSKAVKKNKDATDDERLAVKEANAALKEQRATVRSLETSQRALSKKLKERNITTRNVQKSQEALNETYRKTESRLKQMNEVYAQKAATLRESVADVKAYRASQESLSNALSATEVRVREYERSLERLNVEMKEGKLSKGDYIRQEAQLRNQLELSEKQIKTSRQAIEADARAKDKASKSTDALTQVTRRLAQAYTVLLAAQKATTAVRDSVQGYGELETALTKVEKTTGLATDELSKIASVLEDQSENITPAATTELLRYAEVAGQMGISATEDILKITKAADALSESTDLAGDEAALLLTRMLELSGEGIGSIDNLASAVVELGNSAKASESEIAFMTKEILTGTQAIDLSTAAAAGLGTTLKELGRPAESSRSAFLRLSQVINNAVKDGGDELEKLQQVTGRTAEQLEQDLGSRPEAVLQQFLEGLQRLDDGGQTIDKTLRAFSITSTDTLAVVETLAANTDRLQRNVDLANEAYVKGNAHLEEAAKAYSTQDASIKKLINKFKNLQKAVGEAYADETLATIDSLSDILDGNKESVIGVMEVLPELVEGLGEIAALITELSSQGEGAGFLSGLADGIKAAANGITFSLRGLTKTMLDIPLAAADALGITSDHLDKLAEKSEILNKAMSEDATDIARAYQRMAGESSIAYEGLIDIVAKYGNEMNTLDEKTRTRIQNIITEGQYNESLNSVYRELTAAIVKNHRVLETRKAIAEDTAKTEREAAKAAAERVNALKNESIETNVVIDTTTEYNATISNLVQQQKDGALSTNEFKDAISKINNEFNTGATLTRDYAADLQNAADVTEQFKQSYDELVEAKQAGNVAEEEFQAQLLNLTNAYNDAITVTDTWTVATENKSAALVSLQDQIAVTTTRINDLEIAQKNVVKSKQEEINITARLNKEKTKLKQLQESETELKRIESATYGQLVEMQRVYQDQLDQLNRSFQAGVITKAEYAEKSERINVILNELNSTIGDNTEELDDNTTAQVRNNAAKDKAVDTVEKLSSATNLAAGAYSHLNKEFDFSSHSMDELTARSKELLGYIHQNQRVTDQWWRSLAQLSNQAFERERQIIDEVKTMRQWQEQVESGTLSLDELGKMAAQADRQFTFLSANQLSPLINAIDEARAKMQSFIEEVNQATLDVQDRLDAALGNQEAIIKRQFERELAALESMLAQARLLGNQQAINDLRKAIADLKKAQRIEYREQFGGNIGQQGTGGGGETFAERQARISGKVVTVEFKSSSTGEAGYAYFDNEGDLNTLLSMLAQAQNVNINGNG